MPKALVIANPEARRLRRETHLLSELASGLGTHGVFRTASTLPELDAAFDAAGNDPPELLAIAGGDGTAQVVLTRAIERYALATGRPCPKVALLRGGSMNTVANAIGIRRGTPAELLRAALRANGQALEVERHVMRVGSRYGFLFGTGVVRGFLSEYYGKGDTGPLRALATVARTATSALVGGATMRRVAEPFTGHVELPHERWPTGPYLTIAAGTVEQVGLGFKPFFRSGEEPGKFHIVGITASAAALTLQLPRIWSGKPLSADIAQEAASTHAIIRSDRGPIRYMVDGDLFEHTTTELHLATGPRFQFLL